MQEKVCPKCSRGNSVNRASCANCYTSLEGIAPTPAAKKDPQVTAAPAAPRTPSRPAPAANRPAPSPNPTQVSHTPPPGPQHGQPAQSPYGQPVQPPAPSYRPSSQPASFGPNPAVVVIILIILFGAVAGIGLQFRTKAAKSPSAPPENTVKSYLQAKRLGELDKVLPYLCKSSVEKIEKSFNNPQARSAGITREEVGKMYVFDLSPTIFGLRTALIKKAARVEDKSFEGNKALVHVVLNYQTVSSTSIPSANEFDYILLAEEGKWKIDIEQTNTRNLENEQRKSQKMLEDTTKMIESLKSKK